MFAKNGFQNVLERAKLGKFVLDKFSSEDVSKYSTAERLRMCFEQLGPTFIKLGQLLATRPDLIPSDVAEEFKKLRDDVQRLPFVDVLAVLEKEYGDTHNVFRNIVEQPLASASIAQVHMAQLNDGTEVVIKVQRPGIILTINEDLNVLYTIANLLETYVPETRDFKPTEIVDEFFKTMQLETNFVIEANNIMRFQQNFADDDSIKIPRVYTQYSSEKVLVMEMLDGYPLSQAEALKQDNVDPQIIAKKGIQTFFKMVFEHKFFHGDLHAGNLFILPHNKIGLVDFGVVGRLSNQTRDSIANMMIALAEEDYESLALEFMDIGITSEYTDMSRFTRDLRDLIAPYYGLSFKNVNTGRILLESAGVANKHRVYLPTELILFFKSIITIEGLGRELVEDFDILSQTKDIAQAIIKHKYDPNRVIKDLSVLGRDSISLIYDLPRQLKIALRKSTQGPQTRHIKIRNLNSLKKSIYKASNLLFLGFVISSLILSGTLALNNHDIATLGGLPFISTICYALAMILGILSFFNYIKK